MENLWLNWIRSSFSSPWVNFPRVSHKSIISFIRESRSLHSSLEFLILVISISNESFISLICLDDSLRPEICSYILLFSSINWLLMLNSWAWYGLIPGVVYASWDAFKHLSSSSLEEDSFLFLLDVDVSHPLICSSIEESSYFSLSFLEQEDPSFDVESSEDRLTYEYVLLKYFTGFLW